MVVLVDSDSVISSDLWRHARQIGRPGGEETESGPDTEGGSATSLPLPPLPVVKTGVDRKSAWVLPSFFVR